MFFQEDKVNTRVSVLEEKMSNSENRMSKLDSAIQALSEISQNISRMLAIHEEKIEHQSKTDIDIGQKIKELERKNTEDHEKVIDRFDKLENHLNEKFEKERKARDEGISMVDKKVTKLMNIRLIGVGILMVIGFALSKPGVIIDILTDSPQSPTIERAK